VQLERFRLNRQQAILCIVDVQERLAAVMSERQEVLRRCLQLVEGAKVLGLPVLLTEQYPKGLGPTVAELREALPAYEPVQKLSFDCCAQQDFMQALRRHGRPQVLLSGMETHICVQQTALGLLQAGYQVHLVADAACSRRGLDHRLGLALMRQAGVVVSSTEAVLFELLQEAGTEEFKAISRLIK
jgi:nicotinamidase-related amidase